MKFLQKLRHPNTIEYKGCYLREHTAWVRVHVHVFIVCTVQCRELAFELLFICIFSLPLVGDGVLLGFCL